MDYYSGRRFIQEVFSWSIEDVLNQNLYKDKVRQIPKTFLSVAHYRDSFIFPLLEETRADLYSSMMDVSLSPVCEISYVEKSMDYKEPNDLVYDVGVMKTIDAESGSDLYVPENGDLLAFAELRPKAIADLSWSKGSYKIALVKKKKRFDDEDFDEIQILSSKHIEEQDMLKKFGQKTHFAVFLTNMKTNNRIWKALNLLGKTNMNIIMQVLQTDSTVADNCADCFFREKHYVDSTTLGASIRSLDLNDSQFEAVLSSIAARECRHRNSVKLIWGPPGTGKTKTVGAILFAFLKRKCKTLTCAPTNVAVLEVTTRLLKLVNLHPQYQTYGLGDIILLGNGERMKIDKRDDLLDVFLDYRTHMLSNCFAPLSGWNYVMRLLICLLEDPDKLYCEYLEKQRDGKKDQNFKIQENGTLGNAKFQNNQEKKGDINDNIRRNHDSNIWRKFIFQTLEESKRTWKEKFCHRKNSRFERSRKEGTVPLSQNHEIEGLTFDDYVKWKFRDCKNRMKMHVVVMCTHLPTSFISLKVLDKMNEFLEFLELLDSLLHMVDEGLSHVFTEPINEISRYGFSKQSKLKEAGKQCLEMLKTLRGISTLPDVLGKEKIISFCLKNARLIFCTASTSAKLYKEDMSQLEMLIVDEAAQLKECESTIPSQLPGLRHAILIGDECQLPAMTKSKVSEKAEFGKSLFQRLAQLGHKKHLLNIQYRMHPSISMFPNMEFYGKQILDAPSVKERSYRKRFLQGNMYGCYSFINVAYGHEEFDDGHSRKNMVEVAVVSAIVAKLFKESVAMKERLSIGVISPYNAQVCALENKLRKTSTMYSDSGFSISVRSVDGFQGGEEDIIVISTVRSNPMGLVGFLSNPHRTNVALTRARHCLWIVGDGVTLSNSESVWERLITDAKARGCFYNAEEDKSLTQAIITTLIEDEKFARSPNLNLATKWKVLFDEGFLNSFARIKSMETRNKVISVLKKLLTGWREPYEVRDLTVRNGVSCKMLEHFKIDGWLYLVWTVDILEEHSCFFQVLKVWDVLPLSGMANLAKHVGIFYGKYTVDQINQCNLRCVEGNLQVPMTWRVHSNDLSKDDPVELLSIQFASLSLSDPSEASANCHRLVFCCKFCGIIWYSCTQNSDICMTGLDNLKTVNCIKLPDLDYSYLPMTLYGWKLCSCNIYDLLIDLSIAGFKQL